MKRNKLFFVKHLHFVLFFVLFGVFSLYAEDVPPGTELQAESDSNPKDEFPALLSPLEEYFSDLNDKIGGMQSSLDGLSDSVSKPQIWQIIPAISIAFIALLLSGVVVFLWINQLKLRKVSGNGQRLVDEKHIKEHQPTEESKSASQGIILSEINTLKNTLEDVQYQMKKLDDKINHQSENSSHFQGDLASFQADMASLRQTIKSSNDEISSLRSVVEKNREKLARKEQVENDPVHAFNQWAQNPNLPFPEYFTYVTDVKLEFRTKQEFTDTQTETEWIRNTIGEKKYLFPNPNKIDNLSGPIDKLYKVAGTRKAKGSNSVKISNACQIKEGNFIEYQGELLLL